MPQKFVLELPGSQSPAMISSPHDREVSDKSPLSHLGLSTADSRSAYLGDRRTQQPAIRSPGS